jgi:hypothetical protein
VKRSGCCCGRQEVSGRWEEVVIEVGLVRTEAALLLKARRSVRSWACAWRLSCPQLVQGQRRGGAATYCDAIESGACDVASEIAKKSC